MADIKLFIWPEFGGEDQGDGGVRRVVEAQRRHLLQYGFDIVDKPAEAEVLASHILLGERLLRDPNRPLVVTNHGMYWQEYEWWPWALKANAQCIEAICQADAVTAPSEWVAQAIRRSTMRQVTVIGHGVDLDEWEPAESRGYVLWDKTRVDPVCNQQPLDALAALARDVGFVSTFGAEGPNVTLTGRLPYEQAKQVMRHAGVYLCTSRETFGISTIQAMACGIPVLGFAWGAQREFIRQGETGFLARPPSGPDDHEAYAELLEGLRYCLANRDRLGEAARQEVVERFQWKNVMADYADLYRQTLAAWQQPRLKVSVIVPCYDLERYLPAALDSIEKQTLQDWECIVVDDCSPGDTKAIVAEYTARDPRFRYLRNADNLHVSATRNAGVAEARGRYVFCLDADDMITPVTLAVLSEALDKDRSLAVAYGGARFMLEDGVTPNGDVGADGKSGWPMDFRFDWQAMGRNLVPTACMFRRGAWEAVGGYRRRYRHGEDADFWLRLSSFGFRPQMVTRQDTLLSRWRENSLGKTTPQDNWSIWYPWHDDVDLTPAAARYGETQFGVRSFDPPVISVVIPVGPGHERYLADALDSVQSQAWQQWECIVVNDTGERLPWLPSWVRLLETPGRLGPARARNLGLAAARGVYYIPLDADDFLQPDALSTMFQVIQARRGYVYCDWYDDKGEEGTEVWQADDYDASLLVSKGCLHAVTGMFALADWRRLGGYDEGLPAWEDWDFQIKLADAGVCGTRVPQPLFTYRKTTGFRREDNIREFETSKNAIYSKWRKLWQGGQELMACNSCPGGGGGRLAQRISAPGGQPATPAGNLNEFVLVTYTGIKVGAIWYKGDSGQTYKFGGRPEDRQKYVRRVDAGRFAGRHDFEIAEIPPPMPRPGQTPVLTA